MDSMKIYNATTQNWICLDSPRKREILIDALEVIAARGLITMEQIKILKDLYIHEHMNIPEPLEKIFELYEQEEA